MVTADKAHPSIGPRGIRVPKPGHGSRANPMGERPTSASLCEEALEGDSTGARPPEARTCPCAAPERGVAPRGPGSKPTKIRRKALAAPRVIARAQFGHSRGSPRYSDRPEVPVQLSAPGPIRTGDLQVRSLRTGLTQPISQHPSPVRTRSDEQSPRPDLGSDELGVGTVGAQPDAAVVPSLPERLRFPSDHAASVVVRLSERM
jgi:hypothetical protein